MSDKQEENLLTFPINIGATLKHLRQDMKDDWFYDTIRYEDLITNSKDLVGVLAENLKVNHGVYKPGERVIYDVPKRALGLRYTLEVDFYDRFLYQAICTFLIPYFDPLLSNRVFSHRFDKYGNDRYLFKHRIELWNTFENISHLALVDGDTLLITDLLNYFEQITVEAIESAFVGMIANIDASGAEKNTIRSAVSTLIVLLRKWCYSNKHGLPQNRDASSFIANVVLDAVDKTMVRKGYDYFRYVDDIRIVCKDEMQARKALNELIFELRKLGLNINSKKTEILTNDSDRVEEYFPSKDDTMVLIDTMWKSRSKKVISRSIPILFEFLIKQVEGGETQSRPFRYCINRFKTLISSNLFESKSVLAVQIADSLIKELGRQPVSTDQFCKLLMDLELTPEQLETIVRFIANKDLAIHGWQNYQLIMLMAYKKYFSDQLVDHCKDVIQNDFESPEVAASFIYMASVGCSGELEELIESYDDSWPYQHKRYFLISLQNTKVKTLKPMFSELGFRLKGTVKRMKNNRNFKNKTVYMQNFDTTMIGDIYDEISPYE